MLTCTDGRPESVGVYSYGNFTVIDIRNEQLVPLPDVPKILPMRGNGKRIHISAVYRWAQRGIRGTRLEVVRVGGTTYTSREALQRFASPPAEPFQAAKPDPQGSSKSTARCNASTVFSIGASRIPPDAEAHH
jgi:hypothetical protein